MCVGVGGVVLCRCVCVCDLLIFLHALHALIHAPLRCIHRDEEGANVADALRFEAPLAELKARMAKVIVIAYIYIWPPEK